MNDRPASARFYGRMNPRLCSAFRRFLPFAASLWLIASGSVHARELEERPDDGYFRKFEVWKAPGPGPLLLRKGDRLAICGDSITEQKMYSRIMETYLTACVPELEVTCRQYGWSGEQASGFLSRMAADVLRFDPTVATTCYGMNDHRYVPYQDEIGETYARNQTAVVEAFKAAGVRVVLGSPGTIGLMPGWVRSASGTVDDLNLSLLKLRNIDIEIAGSQGVAFADVFWPMLKAGHEARKRYGEDFMISGKDGVHPGWSGQTVMAWAFLRALGLDGDLGTLSVDLSRNEATGAGGHDVLGWSGQVLRVSSRRYPFCTGGGDPSRDDTIAAGAALVPFHEDLNRFILRVTGAPSGKLSVTWGRGTRVYTREELEKGINLAADFPDNPFRPAFAKVFDAVLAKQQYETRQIKQILHGPEGAADPDGAVAVTEKARAPLADAVRRAVVPVEHSITIIPQP